MSAGCLGTSGEGESGKTSKGEGAKIFFSILGRAFLKLALVCVSVKVEGKRLWNRNQTNVQ